MKFHSVYMGNTYIKCFRTKEAAGLCAMGIRTWLVENNMDPDIVCIKKEA